VIRRRGCTLVLAAILLTPVACTSASSDRKSSAPSTPPSASSSSTSPQGSSSVSQTATDPATREAADRQAVEAAWTKFWGVYETLFKIPAGQLQSKIASVAIDPTRKQMLAEVSVFHSTHRTLYGAVVNRPYWTKPIAGSDTATMGDCMDQSKFGSMSTTTGKKLSVGVQRDNTTASLVKGKDGVWRVKTVVYLLDKKC
jgi:hypothetical protein